MQKRKNNRPTLTINDLDNAPQNLPEKQKQKAQLDAKTVIHIVRDSGFEKAKLEEEISELKQKLKTKEILDKLIEPTARKTFLFMIFYCVFVGACIIFHGFSIYNFEVPESVLGYLVGSTAVTVIGLVGMMVTGIFVGARK